VKPVVAVDPFSADSDGGVVSDGTSVFPEGTVTVKRPSESRVAGKGSRSATCTVIDSGVPDTVAEMKKVHVHGGAPLSEV
jgi:hypothetical protein